MNQSKIKLLVLSMGSLPYLCILIIVLLLGCQSISAKTPAIDSLHLLLSNTTSDVERITLMGELSSQLSNIDSKQALSYAQKALDLSQQTGERVKEAKALFNLGVLVYDTPNRNAALSFFEESERITEELGLRQLQADNLMRIAKFHRYVDRDSAKTVNFFLKSVEVSKAANYNYGTGRSYAKLASFYTRYNQIDLSEEYLELAAEYYLQLKNGAPEIAHYYNEVGTKIWDYNPKKSMDLYMKGMEYSDTYPDIKVSLAKAYSFIGEYKSALKYLKEAIPNLHKNNSVRTVGIAIAQLAEVHLQLGDYKAANNTCDKGILLLSPLGRSYQFALPSIYRIKGIIMEHLEKDEKALEYYTKSLEEAQRVNIGFERVKSTLTIGGFYASRSPQKGEIFCKNSLEEAKRLSFANLEIEACDCLYNIYKEKKASTKALNYYEQKIALSDSLSTLKIEHALEVNSTIAQKDKLLAEQSFQKEIREEQFRFQYQLNKVLAFFTFLGILLIGFLTRSVRKISRQNKEINDKTEELLTANQSLARSNEELERFAHIASHDLKSPLRNILNYTGLLQKLLQKEETPIIKDSLGFIKNSGKRMSQLIEDILAYSKLSSQETSEHEVINLEELVHEISQLSPNTPDGKSVVFEVSELPSLKWNSSKLFLLFKNIIENGIKYNESEKPTIKLYGTHTDDSYLIRIIDNGIGIEQEYYEEVFTMFKRLHGQGKYEGTGLGLATCKKIVDEFEGNISISSEIGKGTTFIIGFPTHLIHQLIKTENSTLVLS